MTNAIDKRKAPLRRVVGAVRVEVGNGGHYGLRQATVIHDELECGHTLSPAGDIYGLRSPARRRCWKCLKELAAHRSTASQGEEE